MDSRISRFGALIIAIGRIGYSLANYPNEQFASTTCNVTEYLTLATKECMYSNKSDHNIHYICSAARWKFSFPTDYKISPWCPKITNTSEQGDFQKATGTDYQNLTSISHDRALNDQQSKKIGSLRPCYYHIKKCDEIKWQLDDIKIWYIIMIIGGVFSLPCYLIWLGALFILIYWTIIRLIKYAITYNILQ